ncbi:substrate-binding domain-containing protein [Compostibacter hankyongensis]|uniref:Sugar ABC transporter substrate-binding protein n=1 Tax=Compostibacter hankyongensis TaxID=1007089 RepID=A0ABP8FPM3_9BACT
MKSGFRYSVVTGIVSLLISFSGCNLRDKGPHQLVIGVSYQDLQNEFIIRLQDAIRAEAKRSHVKLVELDAQGRAEKQISHIENFVSRDVDAIILNPADEQGSAPAVDIAVREHKPVVVVNSLVANLEKASAFVGSPDEEAGRIEASEIMKVLNGKGNIVLIHGVYGHSAEVQRTKGIREIVSRFPDIKITADQTANWSRSAALSVMENILSSNREVNAVIAENDEMALGVAKAIAGAGKQHTIHVIGIDAIQDALRAVADGRMIATVYQDAGGQGASAVDLACRLIRGDTVKHINYIPFQLVTKANVKDFQSR